MAKGSSTPHNMAGNTGKSLPAQPIPGPTNPGAPPSMKKALAKKSMPDKGTSFPGKLR